MTTRPEGGTAPFSLLRNFTGAALAILVAVSLAAGAAAVWLTRSAFALMELSEADSIVEDLVADLAREGWTQGTWGSGPVPPALRVRIEAKLHNFDVVDFALMAPDGASLVRFGEREDPAWMEGVRAATSGRVALRWRSVKPWLSDLLAGDVEGTVETVVPVRDGGRVVAVARLHRDLAATLEPAQSLIPWLFGLAVAVGLVVFGAMWLLVRHADALLKRQHDALEQARLELEARNDLLQELNLRKDEFYASVSQELYAPLLAVRDGLKLLDGDPPEALNPFQREIVGNNLRCTEAALDMIENLVDMSRIDDDADEIETEDVDLVSLVRAVASASQVLAATRSVSLDVRGPEDEVRVEGDRLKLVRVVSALVAQAIKQAAGRAVTISVDREAHLARLRVSDRGLGFAPEQLAALQAPEEAGDALPDDLAHDLALVRRHVERHGGSFSVDSAYGEGATFTVTLPLPERT